MVKQMPKSRGSRARKMEGNIDEKCNQFGFLLHLKNKELNKYVVKVLG
jgi:hypothetical protein